MEHPGGFNSTAWCGSRRFRIAAIAVVLCAPCDLAAQEVDNEAPLADLGVLEGSWHADGDDFQSSLTYRWIFEGQVLEGVNEVRYGESDTSRYHGLYTWDEGAQEITYLLTADDGELHRGRAWWADGVLWHEAIVSGGSIDSYASAMRPRNEKLEYYADHAAVHAVDSLLDAEPLVDTRLPGSDEGGTRYIVLMRLRHDLWERYAETGVWPEDLEANEALHGHIVYWDDQWNAGKVIMTGGMGGEYGDNVARIVLNVTDGDEAEAIVRGDPAVRKHVFQVQIRPFTVHRVEVPFEDPADEGTSGG